MSTRNVDKVARDLVDLRRQIRAVATQPRLAYSSVEGGYLLFNTNDGDPALVVGQQFDGTNASTVLTGPPPPAPTTPGAVAALNGAVITWDGFFADGALVPMDFARVEIHASDDPDDLADTAATLVGTYETPRGGDTIVPIGPGVQYVRLVARSLSGAPSTPSDATSVTAITGDDIAGDVADIANDALDLATAASSDATAALASANGKGKNYYQTSAPTGGTYSTNNDTWYDTDDGYKPHTWNGTAWVDAPFGASAIASLDAGVISTGALNANLIAARTLTVDKIAMGSFDNLIPDPTFLTAYGVVAWPTTTGFTINATAARNGGRAMRCTNTGSDQDMMPNPTDQVKCSEGDAFALQWWASSSAANTGGWVQMGARFKDTAGATTTYILGDDQTGSAGVYTRYTDQVVAPVGTVSVSFFLRSAAGLSTGTVDWDYVSATRAGTAELIVDGSIETKHILAGSITAELLDVNALSAGFVLTGKLTVADPTGVGPGITVTPGQGIVIPQPDGGSITLPADGTAATVTADFIAYSLNVKDALVISGSGRIQGQITIANGISTPSTNPKITYEWPSLVYPALGDGASSLPQSFRGLTDYHGDTTHYTSLSMLFGTGIRKIKKADGTGDGDITGGWSNLFFARGGMCRISNDYYVLGFDSQRNSDWYLYKITGSTGAKAAEFRIGGSNVFHGFMPSLVTNGTNVGMIWIPNTGDLMLRWYNASTTGATVGSDITLKSAVGQQDIGDAVCGLTGTDDLGTGIGNRCLFVSLSNSNAAATKAIMAWSNVTTSAATRQATYDKTRAQSKNVWGLHYDSVLGRVLSADTTGTTRFYSKYVIATSISASYTFADRDAANYPGATLSGTTIINGVDVSGTASGTHETQPSGMSTVSIPAGAWPHFECSPPPDDQVTNSSLVDKANRVGLYWNVSGAPRLHSYLPVSGTAPYTSQRTYGVSMTSGVPDATDTTPTGATAPADTTDFTNAQVPTPGSIKSANNDSGFDGITNKIKIGGDGVFRLGNYGSVRHYGARTRSGNQTLATGTTPLILTFPDPNPSAPTGMTWQTTSGSQGFVIAKAGLYIVNLAVQWTANATGRRTIFIYQQGSAVAVDEFSPGNATGAPTQNLSVVIPCLAGDVISAFAFQSSGGNLDVVGGNAQRLNFTCGFMSQ